MIDLDQLPGFRRRFRITPVENAVQAEVEDDYHCMSVIVRHDGEVAVAIEPEMRRVPWTTCPGAVERLMQTFTGELLRTFAGRGEKQTNCTHLHDLAVLAAAHAFDESPTLYDILVSDAVNKRRYAQIRCNGKALINWIEAEFCLVEPEEVAGIRLDKLRPWIENLEPELREAAKLLQWGNILANGRVIPLEQQSDATKMPPSCYTFQPERAVNAKRVGEVRDFSPGLGAGLPLDEFEPTVRKEPSRN